MSGVRARQGIMEEDINCWYERTEYDDGRERYCCKLFEKQQQKELHKKMKDREKGR